MLCSGSACCVSPVSLALHHVCRAHDGKLGKPPSLTLSGSILTKVWEAVHAETCAMPYREHPLLLLSQLGYPGPF